ncbi:MAG: Mur ligase family protein, partial [Planctomycetota bacterium]
MSASDSAIPQYVPAPTQPGSAHLIGICGSGMSALANVLRGLGWNVTGSDTSLAPPGNAVPSGPKQAVVAARHAGGATPNDCDLVIHSAAVPDEDPERIAARRRGIPSLSLAEALGWVTHGRPLAAVAGTHGKSSATSMMASILRFAGRKPLVVCGARQLGYTSGGDAGRDGLAIVEACEYREHFLHLRPRYAALLGIEPDHFDCFDSDAALDAAYAGFVAQIPSDGLLLVNAACRRAQRVVARARCRRERFAVCWPPRGDGRLAGDVEWTAVVSGHERGHYAFELNYGGETLGYVRLAAAGAHMVSNALAAAALAWHQGVSGAEITAGLSVFPGLHRRIELLGEYAGVA